MHVLICPARGPVHFLLFINHSVGVKVHNVSRQLSACFSVCWDKLVFILIARLCKCI